MTVLDYETPFWLDHGLAAAPEVAAWITPVPGGVGKMTIAMLLKNTLHAARIAHP